MELTLMNSRIIPGETSLIGCVSLLVCRFVYDVVGNGNLRPVMDALRADCIRFRKWTELNLFVFFFLFNKNCFTISRKEATRRRRL